MGTGKKMPVLVGDKPHCPHCDGIELRRQGRFGFWQRAVLPRFGYYPWECGLCRRIFMLQQRNWGNPPLNVRRSPGKEHTQRSSAAALESPQISS